MNKHNTNYLLAYRQNGEKGNIMKVLDAYELYNVRQNGEKGNIMKVLDINELYNVPANLMDIPLFVKKEDKSGNTHIYMYDHASLTNGYVKVSAKCEPVPYKGRFGVGFTVKLHNDNSTHYGLKAYYLELSHGAIYRNGDCIFD